ncbi:MULTISPECIES: hypothetical protein [unclassified Streptomyces]|uniref:hypothetical protein n=1 Tax=unclassified Streptomyces TaxID=2593676 RepID=UPI00382770F3
MTVLLSLLSRAVPGLSSLALSQRCADGLQKGCSEVAVSFYDNVGLQDHNQVLKADVTQGPELTNSVVSESGGAAGGYF